MSDTPSVSQHARRPVRRTAVLGVVALLVGLLTAPVTGVAAGAASGAAGNAELRSDRYERTVLARINRVRVRRDLPRLRVLPCVDVVAERRVAASVRPGRAARLDARRLRRTCDRSLELTASGRGAARVVAKSWLRRPVSRSVLLDADTRFVGVAAAPGRGRWQVTLLVAGAPASGPAEDGDSQDGGTTTAPADDGSTDESTDDGPTGGAAPTTGTEPTDDGTAAMDDLELAVLAATNRRRANHDLPPLQPSACAAGFAGEHSATMATTGTFAHAELADLQSRCGGGRLAENIAMGSGAAVTARQLLDLWMGSEGHRANILDPDLTHLGVGVAVDAGSGQWYATQDFLAGP